MNFDRIIVSSDDSPFIQYWPIVSNAWKKFFPEKKICLAFVTNRNEDDEYVKKLKNFGEVYLFKTISNIPSANQAKMARHVLASQFTDEICMIEDIDTIPLQRNFVEKITIQREKDKLLAVGSEVYANSEHSGKFPMSNITAEGYIFKEIVNPDNLSYEDLVNSWVDIKVYDHKEAINVDAYTFSDESLYRVLINKWNPKKDRICFANRNVNIKNEWIDRSWWGINVRKLNEGKYVCCNFLRPFDENYSKIEPLVDFIYGEKMLKENVII